MTYLYFRLIVITISFVDYGWDEDKREQNLAKQGLDFADSNYVLYSPLRLDVDSLRDGEQRAQSFAYVFDYLTVLTVVHTNGGERIISFRRASRDEREGYHEWLAEEFG
jgi:hypothetical protein